jgi:hypothetical protein
MGFSVFRVTKGRHAVQKIKYLERNSTFHYLGEGRLLMMETVSENDSKGWKKFLKKHWNMVAIFVVAAVLALIAAVYVFLWVVGNVQSSGLVPSTLGPWTMGNIVTFLLHAVFWELLLIGIPVAVAAVAGYLWWRGLPNDEKKEYHFGKRLRTRGGGGGISLLFFIVFCIKVYVDGNWNVAISTWTLDYVVGSMVTILVWAAVIFGIPAAVIGIIWLSREIQKKT